MMDKTAFKAEVRRIGQEYFTPSNAIDQDTVSRFVERMFNLAKNHFDEYVISRGKEVRSSLSEEQYAAFIDFTTGYRAQMDKWIDAHPLQTHFHLVSEQEVQSLWDQQRIRKPLKVGAIGLGSILVLSLFTPTWLLCALGVVTLGLAVKAYQEGAEEDRRFALRQQESQCDRLITQTQLDLEQWLSSAELASEEIIENLRTSSYE